MKGSRAQAFVMLGEVAAELRDGAIDDRRARVLAERIRQAVELLAGTRDPEGAER